MADSDSPASAEPDAATNLTKSFADRLSFPSDSKPKANGTNPGAVSFTPSAKFDWAEDASTPVKESANETNDTDSKNEAQRSSKEAEKGVDMAQQDGATSWLNGTPGLDEPEFDVNVKLADLQDDPNNPLYSVKSFDELNL